MKRVFLIIGAGNIGTSLFRVLHKSQNGCVHLFGRRLWTEFNSPHIEEEHYSNSLDTILIDEAKAIIFAVQDDKIKEATRAILKFNLTNKSIFHLSGTKSSSELGHLVGRGAYVGALHPMQSFANPFEDIHHWKNVLFSFEGDDKALLHARDIADRAKGKLIKVDAGQKVALHLAGIYAANFVVSMLNAAENILHSAGIEDVPANEVLYPLLRGVTFNYSKSASEKILTGPLMRGDVNVLRSHLQFLQKSREGTDLYLYLSKLILNNPQFKVANREKIEEILTNLG